jgi:hypothetical protein
MTTRPPEDAPHTDEPADDALVDDALVDDALEDDDADLPWIAVRPDISSITGPLLKCAPLFAFAALRVGLMMAKGRGSSEGSGMTGLVVGILAAAAPFLWVGGVCALRLLNAEMRLEDGVLTVWSKWHRRVLVSPVAALTGLHLVNLPFESNHKSRIIITSRAGRPLIVDPRHWKAEDLKELWRALGRPARDHGRLAWPEARQRFPGMRAPWRHVHAVLSTLLIVVGGIAYIALVVNLPSLM